MMPATLNRCFHFTPPIIIIEQVMAISNKVLVSPCSMSSAEKNAMTAPDHSIPFLVMPTP